MGDPSILERVFAVIQERKHERPAGSYVVKLLDGGIEAIGAKLREESGELIEAAGQGAPAQIAHEAADLLFHTLVLLGATNVAPSAVWAQLEKRFGVGGLAEKAARGR